MGSFGLACFADIFRKFDALNGRSPSSNRGNEWLPEKVWEENRWLRGRLSPAAFLAHPEMFWSMKTKCCETEESSDLIAIIFKNQRALRKNLIRQLYGQVLYDPLAETPCRTISDNPRSPSARSRHRNEIRSTAVERRAQSCQRVLFVTRAHAVGLNEDRIGRASRDRRFIRSPRDKNDTRLRTVNKPSSRSPVLCHQDPRQTAGRSVRMPRAAIQRMFRTAPLHADSLSCRNGANSSKPLG